MNVEDFIAQIEEEFDDLEPGTLNAESKFREMFEWNSIYALILIALVKTEYDVAVNAEDISKAKTVNDLYAVIASKSAS